MLVFCLLCPLLLDFLALYSKKRSPLFGDALSLRHMTIYSLNIIDLAFYSLSQGVRFFCLRDYAIGKVNWKRNVGGNSAVQNNRTRLLDCI